MNTEYQTGRCVIGGKVHGADVGYLCLSHLDRLSVMLRDIEAEAKLLSSQPSMESRQGNRGAALASHRSPVVLAAVVAGDARCGRPSKAAKTYDPWAFDNTASVVGTLHGWARIVREECDLSTPDKVTVGSERDRLTRSLEWIAAQPWVDEFYGEIKALLGQLHGSNGTGADEAYSNCPVLVDGRACRGKVWIPDELQLVWRRYADRCAREWQQAPGAATCDTCGTTWKTEADKARLKRMIADAAAELTRPYTEDGERMLTAAELVARGIASSAVNVRVIAHRRGIASTAGYYDPRLFGMACAS